MDGREGITLSGSAPYYLQRGAGGGSSGASGSSSMHPVFNAPSGYRNLPNPNLQVQSIVRGNSPVGSSFNVEESSLGLSNFHQGLGVSMARGGSLSEPVKKKRGRPRKYGPDGAGPSALSGPEAVSLALSPMLSPNSVNPAERRKKGRPPGSGRKQRLASVGEWMSSSAGVAFTPHVIHVSPGEDVAEKLRLFAEQRPRALCIMSASGGVSSVTLRQPGNSNETFTYEGRFEILCLSGSYLVNENDSRHNRIGGVACSLSSTEGRVIGGTIAGRLIASRHIQVVVCSFAYGSATLKTKTEPRTKGKKSRAKQIDTLPAPENASSSQIFIPASGSWPSSMAMDQKIPHADIDLMLG
ncbi:AT-hook motif nuclear-localized protein 5-like protein [Drosera capensis]